MDDRIFDEKEAAKILGMSVHWMRRGRWAGYGPQYIKIRRAVRYELSTILAYKEERCQSSTSQNKTLPIALARYDELRPKEPQFRRIPAYALYEARLRVWQLARSVLSGA